MVIEMNEQTNKQGNIVDTSRLSFTIRTNLPSSGASRDCFSSSIFPDSSFLRLICVATGFMLPSSVEISVSVFIQRTSATSHRELTVQNLLCEGKKLKCGTCSEP